MLFQELGKIKRQSIMTSIVLIAVGIIMLLCPEPYVPSLVDVLGYALIILSGVMILGFLAGNKNLMDFITLSLALLLLILGICVLIFNDDKGSVLRVIGWIAGLFLILEGAHSLGFAYIYARRAEIKTWQLLLVLSILLILFGLIVIFNFALHWWDTPTELLRTIGALLLYSSVVGILRLVCIWPIKSE